MPPKDTEKAADASRSDYNSPFYLHPSDHTGLNICPVTLKGKNYEEWSVAMENSLMARRKLGFINGWIPEPAVTDPDREDWETVNSMLVGWIFKSNDEALRSSVSYKRSVKALWEDLRQRFSMGNGPRKCQIRYDIATCRQNGQSVAAYFAQRPTSSASDAPPTSKKHLVCSHCGRKYYDATTCYKLHGFPQHMKIKFAAARDG